MMSHRTLAASKFFSPKIQLFSKRALWSHISSTTTADVTQFTLHPLPRLTPIFHFTNHKWHFILELHPPFRDTTKLAPRLSTLTCPVLFISRNSTSNFSQRETLSCLNPYKINFWQSNQDPLALWKITSPNNKSESYLFLCAELRIYFLQPYFPLLIAHTTSRNASRAKKPLLKPSQWFISEMSISSTTFHFTFSFVALRGLNLTWIFHQKLLVSSL